MRPRITSCSLVAVAAVLLATPLRAQNYNFFSGDGGFTTTDIVGNNSWFYTPGGDGWQVFGEGSAAESRLLSPVLTATGSSWGLSFDHRYNFEGYPTVADPTCYDGGTLWMSVNGGTFTQITPTGGYDSSIATSFGNPNGGLDAFCGASPGYFDTPSPTFIATYASGATTAGTHIQFAWDGAWDSSSAFANPNWQLLFVSFRDLAVGGPTETVPEPATLSLLATGLVGIAGARRRKRRSQD